MTKSYPRSFPMDVWPRAADAEDPWRRRRPVILVAEDNAADREWLRRALAQMSENCDVRMVEDGVDLLGYLRMAAMSSDRRANPAPDLMIVDMKMPRKDGCQALADIAREFELTTPIVIFSGSDDPADIEACYRAGCSSYVTKPIDLRRFNRVVHMIACYWLRLSRIPAPSL